MMDGVAVAVMFGQENSDELRTALVNKNGDEVERILRLDGLKGLGEVAINCQRCLEPVKQALDLVFRLGLVQDEAAIAALPEHYEALLVTGEPARVADIVSDEVLLALPLVPLHENDSRCQSVLKEYQPQADEPRESPFAILEELKQKQL